MKTKAEISELIRKKYKWLLYTSFFFAVIVIISPFVWIWHSWDLFLKIFITAVLGFIIPFQAFRFIKWAVFDEIKKRKPKKTFHDKMNEKMNIAKQEYENRKNQGNG